MHYPPSFIFPHIAFQQTSKNLASLLAIEDQRKREFARHANSRHSRFGTTIAVTLNPKHKAAQQDPAEGHNVEVTQDTAEAGPSQAFVLHRQQAIVREAGDMLDKLRTKRPERRRVNKVDEVAIAGGDNLSVEARQILQGLAQSFLEACFNRTFIFY